MELSTMYIERPRAELPAKEGWYPIKLLRFKGWSPRASDIDKAYFYEGQWYKTFMDQYDDRNLYDVPWTHWFEPQEVDEDELWDEIEKDIENWVDGFPCEFVAHLKAKFIITRKS